MRIEVDVSILEEMVHSIAILSGGLLNEAYWLSANGILKKSDDVASQNAMDFVSKYVDITAGTIGLIHACSELVSDALTNGDVQFR